MSGFRASRALRVAVKIDDPRTQQEIALAARMSQSDVSKLVGPSRKIVREGDSYFARLVRLAEVMGMPLDVALEEIVPAESECRA